MITATDEQVAVIRRGWMGTAIAVHPEVAGLTDFVESRLVDLESRGELAEQDLLAVVEAAAQMVLAAGTPDQARDTSRRMRRTVYEFLLALDASSPTEQPADEPERRRGGFGTLESQARSEHVVPLQPAPNVALMQPAELEVSPTAAVPAPAPSAADDHPAIADDQAEDEQPDGAGSAAAEGFHSGNRWAGAGSDPDLASEATPLAPPPADLAPTVVAPRAGFHLTDPVDMLPEGPVAEEVSPSFSPLEDEAMLRDAPAAAPPEPNGHEPAFELMPAPAEPEPPARDAATGTESESTAASDGAADFIDLVTPPDATPARPPALQTPAPWTAKFTEIARPAQARHEPSLVPDVWADDEGLGEPEGDHDGPEAGAVPASGVSWRVRKPELAGEGARRASSGDLPADSWQPADQEEESQPDLSTPRRGIEDLLRRKKYDQTGAILQQLAQDNACRAVAELALDTGDRCRAMGKRMAATSCYLAASRADPVFEEPLTRLADVCIDDRDVDLAVSYLERVARLTRARGDVKGALRIYRKIHAIAPYRNDILDVLMRAQTTGRLDP
ncbi:MAG: tetratricopeptide repeat protein [Candidatus Dormibacteria bacterium]